MVNYSKLSVKQIENLLLERGVTHTYDRVKNIQLLKKYDLDNAGKYDNMSVSDLKEELRARNLAVTGTKSQLLARLTAEPSSTEVGKSIDSTTPIITIKPTGAYETKVFKRGRPYYELIHPYVLVMPDLLMEEMQTETAKKSVLRREWNIEAKWKTILFELESLDMVAVEKNIESKFLSIVTAGESQAIKQIDHELVIWFLATYPHLSYLMTKTELGMKFLALRMNKLSWLSNEDVATMINADINLVADYTPTLDFALHHEIPRRADAANFSNWPIFMIEYAIKNDIINDTCITSSLKEIIALGYLDKFKLVYPHYKKNDTFNVMDLIKSAQAGHHHMVTTILEKHIDIYSPTDIPFLYLLFCNELSLEQYPPMLLKVMVANRTPIPPLRYLVASMNIGAIKNVLDNYAIGPRIGDLKAILEHFSQPAARNLDVAINILDLLQLYDNRTYKSFARLSTVSVELMKRIMLKNDKIMRADPYSMLYNAMILGGIPEVMYVLANFKPSHDEVIKANEYAKHKHLWHLVASLSSYLTHTDILATVQLKDDYDVRK